MTFDELRKMPEYGRYVVRDLPIKFLGKGAPYVPSGPPASPRPAPIEELAEIMEAHFGAHTEELRANPEAVAALKRLKEI